MRWWEVAWGEVVRWGGAMFSEISAVRCFKSPALIFNVFPHAGDSKECKCKDCTYTVCWWLVFRMPQLICVSCATFFLSLFCFFACSLFPPLPYNLLLYWQTKIDKCTGKPVKKTGEGNVYPFIVLGWFSRVEMYIEFSTTKLHQHTHATHATHTHTHTHIHTYIHTRTYKRIFSPDALPTDTCTPHDHHPQADAGSPIGLETNTVTRKNNNAGCNWDGAWGHSLCMCLYRETCFACLPARIRATPVTRISMWFFTIVLHALARPSMCSHKELMLSFERPGAPPT